MQVDTDQLRPYLRDFDFQSLFVEGLGWNYHQSQPIRVRADEFDYSLEPVAEKAGFVVYECSSAQDGNIPQYPIRRKIESQIAEIAFEHLVIFADDERNAQVWQWVKRESGKPAACREQEFHRGQGGEGGEPLLQRLRQIAFSLDEERELNISKVTSRVRKALDAERVTKRFYERFRNELTAFGNFIAGITAQGDRDWYASLMLNRMMFVYFVQKQGFLDGDLDYLRNRLELVRSQAGSGHFQQFYRIFLLRLFHEGLGQQEDERSSDLAALLGQVPFLNGGLFDVHDLERNNPDIGIPDEAFERVFDFFDGYRWHLDERPYREDNEIDPDVLGYIFEKYVNQKQMGAYYTKEDITGYISRNTVIPFLFDAARKKCPVAFGPDGGVWRLLRDDPDRYIYPAVGHGISWNARRAEGPVRLDAPFELPNEIAAGIDDVSKRGGWNRPAADEYALPTETWREVVARRQRYADVRAKLESGEVQEVNGLITLNLDVEQFAKDVIAQSEGPELLRAFWRSMRDLSALDPTCGSGAFLFAALNILEPLYTACMEGMRGFLDDLERSERRLSPNALSDFKEVLAQVEKHHSERYYILKSIVLDNLYGVDIMEEAVEICKLRLFLKLVAQLETYDQIEPLPDIDFNIRAGNTLVGFTSLDAVRQAMTITPEGQYRAISDQERATLARIEEEAEIAARAFRMFQRMQTDEDMAASDFATAKTDLREQLDELRAELDRYLATEYGVDHNDLNAYKRWQTSHQPFHWFVEFYGTVNKGGFDVVIGNPPYVEYRTIKKSYTVRGYTTERCGNLYAFVMERNAGLIGTKGRSGMIVPHSAICTDRMASVQQILLNTAATWVSSYDIRPAKLFGGVDQRLCIYVSLDGKASSGIFSSRYHRWHENSRTFLLQDVEYVTLDTVLLPNTVPKAQSPTEVGLLEKMLPKARLTKLLSRDGEVIYYHNSPRYWVRAMDFAPYFWNERDGEQLSTQVKTLKLASKRDAEATIAALNSSLFYWWFLLLSDCRHLNLREIESFPIGLERMSADTKIQLAQLTQELMKSFKQNSQRKETRYRTTGKVIYDEFRPKLSKPIIDEIDRVLAEHYGFTDEELDFIINYDIKYRMGIS